MWDLFYKAFIVEIFYKSIVVQQDSFYDNMNVIKYIT